MMRFDEKSGNFYCTELGRIASHFYIQYSSVETYNEMLRRHMNDSEVIGYNLLHLLHVSFSVFGVYGFWVTFGYIL
jgi:replicative superfamily II helicase